MSTESVNQLLERAAECIDYFEEKLPAKLIEKDINNQDYDMLWVHVREAELEIARQEHYGYDIYPGTNVLGDNDVY